MTHLIALLSLLSIPVFVSMLNQQPARRLWAFSALAALPLLSNLPFSGFLYSWDTWSGTARGYAVALTDAIALALIFTRRTKISRLPFLVVILFYGFTLFLSVLSSKFWITTTFSWWQFLRLLLLYYTIAGEANRLEVRNALLIGLSGGAIYQASYVIPQKLTGVVQATGTTVHQNILGLMIELVMLPLFAALLMGNRKAFTVAGILACLVCIAGTGSRGTVGIAGGALVGLALVSLIRHTTPRKSAIVATGIALLGLATPLAMASLNQRFKGASFVTEEDVRDKMEVVARAMASDHPIGVGANQFVITSNSGGYAERAQLSWFAANRSVPAHNAYLLARAETGWAGEAGFIGIILLPILTGLWLAFKDRKSVAGEAALGSAFALIANAIHNNYEFATHTYPVFALVFINIAIIAGVWRGDRMTKRGAKIGKRKAPAYITQPPGRGDAVVTPTPPPSPETGAR